MIISKSVKKIILSTLIMTLCVIPESAFSTEYPSVVSATIGVGSQPIDTILTSNGSTLFVANIIGGSITKIDTSNNQVVSTLGGLNGPVDMAISDDDTKLYVSEYGVYGSSNNVAIIDLTTFTIASRITVGQAPHGVAIADNHLYVTCVGNGNVYVVDTMTETVTANIYVGGSPRNVTLSRDKSTLYVSDMYTGNISVINTVTNTLIENLNFGIHPFKMTMSLGGKYLYTANYGSTNRGGESTASIIDLESNTLIKTIDVGGNAPVEVVITSCGSYLLVTQSNWDSGSNNNKVAVIDTVTNEVVSYTTVQANPFGIVLNKDGSKAYVANRGSNNVTVLSGDGCIFYRDNNCGGQ